MGTAHSYHLSSAANLNINEVPSNTNTMFNNAGAQSPSHNEAEMLVRALRNVILPLVRPAGEEHKRVPNHDALGPDGEEFIIALQKFMSSFLCSQQGSVSKIEVDLQEPISDESVPPSSSLPSDQGHDLVEAMGEFSYTEPLLHGVVPESDRVQDREAIELIYNIEGLTSLEIKDILQQQKALFREKVMNALRAHVFNIMPIRLLYFKPHGSRLQIALIERGEIYAHIASNLENSTEFITMFQEFPRMTSFSRRDLDEVTIPSLIYKYSRYAILSHTWLCGASGEVTYSDWNRGEFDARQPGYQKLVNFCKAAWQDHGVAFGWMDTICINKESSAELDESIRSMYKWYEGALICITYLAETATLSDMSNDTWFTRGWTLQELFAPSHIKFYNTHWKKLVKSLENDKKNPVIHEQIEQATTITGDELRRHITRHPISRRMQMAAKRQVTREEDVAYSLMGIFNVSISIAYGEGAQRAFSRLLHEILNSSISGVWDIFNWAGDSHSPISALLPSTLEGYLRRSAHIGLNIREWPTEPLTLTHLGLRITVVLMPAIAINESTSQHSSIGDYHGIVNLPVHYTTFLEPIANIRWIGGSYSVLDARTSEGNIWNWRTQVTFGVLNTIGDIDGSIINIPEHCIAVALDHNYMSSNTPSKLPTESPIIFTLNEKWRIHNVESRSDYPLWHRIRREDLAKHGMKLVTLYL